MTDYSVGVALRSIEKGLDGALETFDEIAHSQERTAEATEATFYQMEDLTAAVERLAATSEGISDRIEDLTCSIDRIAKALEQLVSGLPLQVSVGGSVGVRGGCVPYAPRY